MTNTHRWVVRTALVVSAWLVPALQADDHAAATPTSPTATESEPSFASVLSAIDGGAWTLEKVVGQLPPAYRSHYSLVFDSRSLQPATPAAPRVILYGRDAKLLLAFNGDPSRPGYLDLEVIAYDDLTHRFQFHEIRFSADGKTRPHVVPAPRKCALCHGEPPMPRWDVYRLWPGVYGISDDGVIDPHADPHEPENAQYAAFQRTRQQQVKDHAGRYSTLEDLQPYDYDGIQDLRPNTRLSTLLGNLARDNFAARIRLDPNLYPLRYALAAIFTRGCGNLPGFFPPDLEPRVQAAIRAIAENVHAVNSAAEIAKQRRVQAELGDSHADRYLAEIGPNYPSAYYDVQTAALRLLIEGFSDKHLIDWSLEFEPRSYEFDLEGVLTNGGQVTEDWVRATTADKQAFDPRTLYEDCSQLRQKQLAAFPWTPENKRKLRGALQKLSDLRVPDPSAPFEKCVACHLPGNTSQAPEIPFSDRRRLIERLTGDAALREQMRNRILPRPANGKAPMPMGLPFSEAERDAIRSFLDRLSPQAER
jgi:hypothetical protein